MVQTVDDRTFQGLNVSAWTGKIDGLDLTDRATQSLVLLCLRFQQQLPDCDESLTLLVDQGLKRPSAPFGETLFRNWKGQFRGEYVVSSEPLMQPVDFVAYCINRSTVLQMKGERSHIDFGFLKLVESMEINTNDLCFLPLPGNFTVQDFDELHHRDRVEKGLEPPRGGSAKSS